MDGDLNCRHRSLLKQMEPCSCWYRDYLFGVGRLLFLYGRRLLFWAIEGHPVPSQGSPHPSHDEHRAVARCFFCPWQMDANALLWQMVIGMVTELGLYFCVCIWNPYLYLEQWITKHKQKSRRNKRLSCSVYNRTTIRLEQRKIKWKMNLLKQLGGMLYNGGFLIVACVN